MRRALLPALALAASLAAPARAAEGAAEPGPQAVAPLLQPYAAVRSLQALQDQVAKGSTAAQGATPALLAHIAEVFAAAGAATWTDPRNAEAAALYLFSAGQPAAIRGALAGADLKPETRKLVEGALAYAEGEDARALALLGGLDPRSLPRGLGGHLALVLASLYGDKDPRKSGEMLDQARLLVPGTLVEEAALRRQIFLLAQPATADRFAALSRQYLRRFRASVFAGNFRARLRSFATDLATAGDAAALARLDPIIGDLSGAEAKALYLSLARAALVRGRVEAARFAAARAAGFATDPAETAEIRLYAAAAGAATVDAATAGTALKAIDPNALGPDDAALRAAAIAVASATDAAAPDTAAGPSDATPAANPSDAAVTETIARAGRALAAADAMLGPNP